MNPRRWALALLLACLSAPTLASTSVRYALIVGNNHGETPPEVVLPDLDHAETEAQALRDSFIRLGNFRGDRERLVLLTGAGRQEILDAAATLARRHRQDREQLGDVPTLFAFYYTGHGLDGALLTADAPLSGGDLATIFTEMNATFTVGIFDACYSGSLDLDTLKAKGLRTTPGFNAFNELPREVLNSSGTMWFVSSQPDQVSYEDKRLGGVFTHFFIEGMERASGDSFGVTLEQIWEYARSRTQTHTARSGRPQIPQKMIRNLTSSGPLYFSFPGERSAALVFEERVQGSFLVRYAAGQLTELVEKDNEDELRVAVYPSEIVLERVGVQPPQRQVVELTRGETVWVRDQAGWSGPSFGSSEEALQVKGGRLEELVLTRKKSASLWGHVDAGYRFSWGSLYSPVSTHNLDLGLRLDYGLVYGRLGLTLGWPESESYPAWGYALNRGELALELGPAIDLGPVRLGLAGRAGLFGRDVRYRNGDGALEPGLTLGGLASLLLTLLEDPVSVRLGIYAGASAEYAIPVAPEGAPPTWQLVPLARAGVAVGLGR